MATTHLKDAAVVVDTYTDKQGNERKRWKNIGRLLRNDNGEFLVLDRTFNLAGVPGQGDVLVSLFDPKPREDRSPRQHTDLDAPPSRDLDDSIPF